MFTRIHQANIIGSGAIIPRLTHWPLWNYRHVIFKQILVIGAVRQQAITWANVDPDLYRHLASPGHSELSNHEAVVYIVRL